MSLEVILGAGTCVRYSLDLQTPNFTEIPGLLTFGAVGTTAEAKSSTVLKDTIKKNKAGMLEGPDKNFKGQLYSSNTDQKAFLDACKLRRPMLIEVEWPDKPDPLAPGTGTKAQFEYQPLGFEIDETQAEEWIMFTVNGKQNSIEVFTDPVTL